MSELNNDYYQIIQNGDDLLKITRRDLTMLCDWLAYYGSMDYCMSEHYAGLVVKTRNQHNLKSHTLLPVNNAVVADV